MKISFNWCGSIIIIMISFILFIIYIAFFHKKISSELVSDHYYEEEIEYQKIISEKKNAIFFPTFNVQVMPIGIKISSINGNNLFGTLNLLRLSNKQLDVTRVIQLDTMEKKIIPANILKYGTYLLKIRWKSSGKRFFVEKKIQWKF